VLPRFRFPVFRFTDPLGDKEKKPLPFVQDSICHMGRVAAMTAAFWKFCDGDVQD